MAKAWFADFNSHRKREHQAPNAPNWNFSIRSKAKETCRVQWKNACGHKIFWARFFWLFHLGVFPFFNWRKLNRRPFGRSRLFANTSPYPRHGSRCRRFFLGSHPPHTLLSPTKHILHPWKKAPKNVPRQKGVESWNDKRANPSTTTGWTTSNCFTNGEQLVSLLMYMSTRLHDWVLDINKHSGGISVFHREVYVFQHRLGSYVSIVTG